MKQSESPETITEAKAVYSEKIAKEKAELDARAAEKKINEKRWQAEHKKVIDAKKKFDEEMKQHENDVYTRIKPATQLMDSIVGAFEDPSNLASKIVCKHIAKTGSDDNIYIYGSDYHKCPDKLRDAIVYPYYKGERYDDMAKSFLHMGTQTRYINTGPFIGYKLVGYGHRHSNWILRLILGHSPTWNYHIYLRKTIWTKLFGRG